MGFNCITQAGPLLCKHTTGSEFVCLFDPPSVDKEVEALTNVLHFSNTTAASWIFKYVIKHRFTLIMKNDYSKQVFCLGFLVCVTCRVKKSSAFSVSMCVYLCVCVCALYMCFNASVCMCLYASTSVSVSVCVCVCMCVCVCVWGGGGGRGEGGGRRGEEEERIGKMERKERQRGGLRGGLSYFVLFPCLPF